MMDKLHKFYKKRQAMKKPVEKKKRRKELRELPTAQQFLTKENVSATSVKRRNHKKRTSFAEYQQLTAFDSKLIQRCRENGMSDGEIREWMEEI